MPRPEKMWDATQPDKAQLEEEGRDVARSPVTPKPDAKSARDSGGKSGSPGWAL